MSRRPVLCGARILNKDVQLRTMCCGWTSFFCTKERRVKTVKGFKVISACLVALAFAVITRPAMAQSTIFNIPSTDTVDKGKGYFEFDFLPQMPGTPTTRAYIYNPRLVVGVAKGLEVGVNFPITHNSGVPSPNNFTYVQPNFKYKFYANDDQGWAAS